MEMSVTDFKAQCTKVFRAIEKQKMKVEITRRGKIIAVVQPAGASTVNPKDFLGCLHNTLTFHPSWDEPLGEDDWEACS
jgi:antitoxin (DNA-binding transcriptional repressor) of toxin-antitoxin stability system